MKKFWFAVLGVITAVALTVPVMAVDTKAKTKKTDKKTVEKKPEKKPEKKAESVDLIKKADLNNDGKLSLEEFSSVIKNDADAKFEAVDANKDGFMTREELTAATQTYEKAKAAKDAKEADAQKEAAAAAKAAAPAKGKGK